MTRRSYWKETVHEMAAREFIENISPDIQVQTQANGVPVPYLIVYIPLEQRDEFYAAMIAGGYELVCFELCRMAMSNKRGENDLVLKWFLKAEEVKRYDRNHEKDVRRRDHRPGNHHRPSGSYGGSCGDRQRC